MSLRRSILGIWVIERHTGRNLVARAYGGIDVDMDLIAPFLSATHTFIDKASNESLQTIDTVNSRYVWVRNDHLLLVMIVSKAARIGHMRFLLKYALKEFVDTMIPKGRDLGEFLSEWKGNPETFASFGAFLDELVEQYEMTDESLVAGKSMDSLEVYNHLFRELMRIDVDRVTKRKIVRDIKRRMASLIETYPFLEDVPVDEAGVEVLEIDVLNNQIPYRALRAALEDLFQVVAEAVRSNVDSGSYRDCVFSHVMRYVKEDLKRLQTYAILDDVVRYLF